MEEGPLGFSLIASAIKLDQTGVKVLAEISFDEGFLINHTTMENWGSDISAEVNKLQKRISSV